MFHPSDLPEYRDMYRLWQKLAIFAGFVLERAEQKRSGFRRRR